MTYKVIKVDKQFTSDKFSSQLPVLNDIDSLRDAHEFAQTLAKEHADRIDVPVTFSEGAYCFTTNNGTQVRYRALPA